MMLAAGLGVKVKIEAVGNDATEALDDIKLLFANKFGESE